MDERSFFQKITRILSVAMNFSQEARLNWIFILPHVQKLPELEFLRDLLMQAPGFVMIFLGPEYRFVFTNREVDVMLGGLDVTGLTMREVAPEPLQKDIIGRLDYVWKSGKPFMARDLPYRAFTNNSPDFEIRYADFLHHPIRDKNGEIIGIYVQGTDVTERKHFHENLALLKQQSISVVRDIIKMIDNSVNQALKNETDLKLAEEELQRRFTLLANIQSSFIDMRWQPQNINEVVENALSLMLVDISAIEIKGEAVALNAIYHAPFILLLQGLIYNAIENNIALKNIRIHWHLLENNMLNLVWREENLDPSIEQARNIDNSLIYRLINIDSNNNISTLHQDKASEYHINMCLDI